MNNSRKRGLYSANLPSGVTQCPFIDSRGCREIFYEPIKRKRRIGAERVSGDYKDIIIAHPPRAAGNSSSAEALTSLQSSWLAKLINLGDVNISELDTIVAEMTKEARRVEERSFAGRLAVCSRNNHVEFTETSRDTANRAVAVHKAYEMDKELAMRKILDPEGIWLHQTTETMSETIFMREGQAWSIPPSVVPDLSSPSSPDEELFLLRPFLPEEVSWRMKIEQFSVAGLDGLKASSWSKVDPGGIVLSELFSRCLRLGRVPFSWKHRRTIQVKNGGDSNSVDSWRPHSILPMIAKIYAGCISDRVSAWARMGKRVSYPFQKGLNSSDDGLEEHAFLMQAILEDAWRNQKEVALAWLKLEETLCSIDFKKISGTLRLLGMPEKIFRALEDFYSGDHTYVSLHCNQLGSKRVDRGCPLYPILFILSIEPIIRAGMAKRAVTAYHLGSRSICILAHAGDMALVARNSGMLRLLLWTVGKTADWMGIRFKASRCASLHLKLMKVVTSSTFQIQGNNLKSLNQGEFYNFLGVPIGFRVKEIPVTAKKSFLKDLHALDASNLTPWQKLNALHVFLIPQFESYIKAWKVMKKDNVKVDKAICKKIRSWMFLPQRSSKEIMYLPPSLGGAGFLPFQLSSDLLSIEHGFHLLTSEDPTVKRSALENLQDVVHRKIGRGRKVPKESILCKYLNGDCSGRLGADVGDASSIWSRLRKATRHVKSTVRIKWGWNKSIKKIFMKISAVGPNVKMVKISYRSRSRIYKILRRAAVESFLQRLITKPDQGKVYELSSVSPASNHFLKTGHYTRFCDWRFIHRARLNVLPLNAALRGGLCNETKCRWCDSAEETLPHVLNHCPAHMKTIMKRHDTVLNLLVSSLPSGWNVAVDKVVTGINSSLRPDLLAWESLKGPFHIVDVTVAFENRSLAFTKARKLKIRKYSGLAKSLRDSLGSEYSVTLDALVIGSLGSWDQGNDKVFKRLHISGKKARIIKEKMVSMVIRWSRNIYVEHVTGVCQCN